MQVTSLGPMPVKGLADPVEVYELTGVGAAALAPPGRRRARAHAASWVATPRSSSSAARSTGARRARSGGRGRRASRAWASRASSSSSPTPTASRAGWSSRPARSPTARPPATSPSSSCSGATSRSRERDDPREIREKVTGKLLTLGPGPRARRCRRSWRSSTCPVEDAPVAGARSRRSAASGRSTPSSACSSARARSSRCSGLRGPALDRRRDPGAARRPGRGPARGAPPAPRQLPPRVPARLGQQDLLHASSGSIRSPPESAEELLEASLGADAGARAAQAHC